MTFDTFVLDRARDRRRRRQERDRRRTLHRLLRLLDVHSAELEISEAYVFGSVTETGRFREDSDIDIAVEDLDAEPFFRAMSLLSAALDRPVDLVRLRECHFADRIGERGMRWTRTSS